MTKGTGVTASDTAAISGPARARTFFLGAALVTIYVVWGSTYLAIAVTVRAIPPFLMMGLRSLVAGALLLAVAATARRAAARYRGAAAVSRVPGSEPMGWGAAFLCGGLLFLGCQGTLAYAERQTPSGLSAVFLATVPIWLLLAELVWPVPGGRRPRAAAVAALAPGIAGVVLLSWPPSGGAPALSAGNILLLLLSAFAWALGSALSRRIGGGSAPFATAGRQLLGGGVICAVLGIAVGEGAGFSPATVPASAWLALAYLVVGGSVVGFTAYLWLLRAMSPVVVGTYTFANPAVAVLLGWLALGETLTPRMMAGAGLVAVSLIALLAASARRR